MSDLNEDERRILQYVREQRASVSTPYIERDLKIDSGILIERLLILRGRGFIRIVSDKMFANKMRLMMVQIDARGIEYLEGRLTDRQPVKIYNQMANGPNYGVMTQGDQNIVSAEIQNAFVPLYEEIERQDLPEHEKEMFRGLIKELRMALEKKDKGKFDSVIGSVTKYAAFLMPIITSPKFQDFVRKYLGT